MKCMDMVGVFFICFIKSSIQDKIKNFDSMVIKTGLMGAMGNKGSLLVRFSYQDTTLAFSCGHMAAGSSNNSSRISELTDILSRNFPIYKELKFKEHNAMFVFGDLNFRIDLEYNTCLNLIKNKNLSQLIQYDQFNKCKQVNFSLIDIDEGKINFDPTYKYTIGSFDYATKKKRVPSWCDRILYKKSKHLTQVAYDRVEYTHSDHRPVYGLFNISAFQEIRDRKSILTREIKQNILLGIDNTPTEIHRRPIEKKFTFSNENQINLPREQVLQKQTSVLSHSNSNPFDDMKKDDEIMSFFK